VLLMGWCRWGTSNFTPQTHKGADGVRKNQQRIRVRQEKSFSKLLD
jgi:hypothetical protein